MVIDTVQELCKCLSEFSSELSSYIDQYNEDYIPSSIIEKYILTYQDKDAVFTVFLQASILIEACSDHFSCFIKTITEPVLPISMYSAVRSIIESSSIAIWLLNPKIELSQRIYRSLCFRLKFLEEQKKCAPYFSKKDVETNREQIQKVKLKAMKLGFVEKPNGILKVDNLKMPTYINLAQMAMGSDFAYRIFSTMVHNHPSAIYQTSYKRVEIDNKEQKSNHVFLIEKTFNLESAITLSKFAVVYLAKPIWMKSCLYGWDEKQLLETISKYYQLLGIGEENAFWKFPKSKE